MIAVIGAAGTIGRNVVAFLEELGRGRGSRGTSGSMVTSTWTLANPPSLERALDGVDVCCQLQPTTG